MINSTLSLQKVLNSILEFAVQSVVDDLRLYLLGSSENDIVFKASLVPKNEMQEMTQAQKQQIKYLFIAKIAVKRIYQITEMERTIATEL